MIKIKPIIIFMLCVIIFSNYTFAQSNSGDEGSVIADKIKLLSKSDQRQRFPLVNDSKCIGVFYKNELKGCIWINFLNLTQRLSLLHNVKFEAWDGKKVKDFYNIFAGITHRFMFLANLVKGKYYTQDGVILKYRALDSAVSIGYTAEIGAITLIPNLFKKYPMELSPNNSLVKKN